MSLPEKLAILAPRQVMELAKELATKHFRQIEQHNYSDKEWLHIFSQEAQNMGLTPLEANDVADEALDYMLPVKAASMQVIQLKDLSQRHNTHRELGEIEADIVPVTLDGETFDAIEHQGKMYQVHGGIRNPLFINTSHPLPEGIQKVGLDALNIALNDGESATHDPRSENNETHDRAPWAEKGTESNRMTASHDTSAVEEAGWHKTINAPEYSHYTSPNLPSLMLEVTKWGFTLFTKAENGWLPVNQGDLDELDGFLQGLKGKSASKKTADSSLMNVQTFAPNVQRQINRNFDKMPARYSETPWTFERKRRERGTKPKNQLAQPPVQPKKPATPELEFHDAPRSLPPRDDMKRHMDQTVQKEIDADVNDGSMIQSDMKQGDRTIDTGPEKTPQSNAYRYAPVQTQPIAEDPKGKKVPSWVTGALKSANIGEDIKAAFRGMQNCHECGKMLKNHAIVRLVEHLKTEHKLGEMAEDVAGEAFKRVMEFKQQPIMAHADDYCEACGKEVANRECDHGILCDGCDEQVHGSVGGPCGQQRNAPTSGANPSMVLNLLSKKPMTTGEIEKALGGGKHSTVSWPILQKLKQEGRIREKQMRWHLIATVNVQNTNPNNLPAIWDGLTPKGRSKFLGMTGKPMGTLLFRPWGELDEREQRLMMSWFASPKPKAATDNWLDFVAEQEEEIKGQFVKDVRMQELARMENVTIEDLWQEVGQEYLRTYHDPLP